jgi:hypothetical protein
VFARDIATGYAPSAAGHRACSLLHRQYLPMVLGQGISRASYRAEPESGVAPDAKSDFCVAEGPGRSSRIGLCAGGFNQLPPSQSQINFSFAESFVAWPMGG